LARGIRHFIWGYQPNFRIGRKVSAKSLFQLLDPRLEPEVFLVGIRIEDREDRYPACVEPEEDFWIPSEAFNDVLVRANGISPTYPEHRVLQSHPLAQKWQDEALQKKAVQDAIREVIDSCPDRPEGMRYFPSWPVQLEGFLVSVVLGLQETVMDSHTSLVSDSVAIHKYRSFKVPRSLLEAVVGECLGDAASELLKPEPGSDPMSGKSRDEMLRAAGRRMVGGAAQRADTFDNQEGCEEGLFDACNRASSLKYEGADSVGHILLARADHHSVARDVTFEGPVSVSNSRSVRKLLELAKGDLALHMNAKGIFGLARLGDYDTNKEDVYGINILAHHRWELTHAGQPMMQVNDGFPCLPAPIADPSRIRRDLYREFRHVGTCQLDLLVELVCEAGQEKHGTMLVISEDAESETHRLSRQATLVEPCLLSPALLKQLTPIDGAVLLDPQGVCHSIGMILDGIATENGNPARGARYNSAIRYVASQNCACMAVVVSEDGGIDLVPDRLPPVRCSDIEDRLSELQALLSADRVNRRRYHQLADWFGEKRFYLLPEHCESLNRLIAGIDERIAAQDPKAPRIVRGEFGADPAFDQTLYYEEELHQ